MINIMPSMFLLESAISSSMTDMPFSERIMLGLRVTLLGMGTCFLVLGILWGVLALFKVIFARDSKHPAKALPQDDTKQIPEADVSETKSADDGELIAVLTAAAYAYLEAESAAAGAEPAKTKFRVVSFRRTGSER